MTTFVLDNSVTMRWCFENNIHVYADSILRRLETGDDAIVPALWLYEVSSVIARAQITGALTAKISTDFLESLKVLPIVVDEESTARVLGDVHQAALAHRLTSYDAAYLELASRKQLPLATLDNELIRACKAAGVTVL